MSIGAVYRTGPARRSPQRSPNVGFYCYVRSSAVWTSLIALILLAIETKEEYDAAQKQKTKAQKIKEVQYAPAELREMSESGFPC